jgi:hypothetical protein
VRAGVNSWFHDIIFRHFNYFRGHSSALGFQRAVRLRFERVKTARQCGV